MGLHQVLLVVEFMLELEDNDVFLALHRKLEIHTSEAKEQWVDLENKDGPDMPEVPG